MQIKENFSLKSYNTFGVEACAKYFAELHNSNDIIDIAEWLSANPQRTFVLGGGSNVLFTKDFDGLVIFVNNQGITIVEDNDNFTIVEASAGTKWQEFIEFLMMHDIFGAENLAMIQGKVGAAAVQNIGAYNAEQKDFCYKIKGYNLLTNSNFKFSPEQCNYSYRDSIFKHELKDAAIITAVQYKFSKDAAPDYSYKDLSHYFLAKNIHKPTHQDVYEAVKSVRSIKLPDPAEIGNAGSFFKNPVVNHNIFDSLKEKYPDLPCYVLDEKSVKIPAAALIESCGFKGIRFSDAGVCARHSLILVNYGCATGLEIATLARKIQDAVKVKFNIEIEPEVLII